MRAHATIFFPDKQWTQDANKVYVRESSGWCVVRLRCMCAHTHCTYDRDAYTRIRWVSACANKRNRALKMRRATIEREKKTIYSWRAKNLICCTQKPRVHLFRICLTESNMGWMSVFYAFRKHPLHLKCNATQKKKLFHHHPCKCVHFLHVNHNRCCTTIRTLLNWKLHIL